MVERRIQIGDVVSLHGDFHVIYSTLYDWPDFARMRVVDILGDGLGYNVRCERGPGGPHLLARASHLVVVSRPPRLRAVP